ncbi:MAG: hypothetical protein ACRELY_15635 [Polyangiaceae bacterium]
MIAVAVGGAFGDELTRGATTAFSHAATAKIVAATMLIESFIASTHV